MKYLLLFDLKGKEFKVVFDSFKERQEFIHERLNEVFNVNWTCLDGVFGEGENDEITEHAG